MSETTTASRTCLRCGKTQPESTLIGGLCPHCVARSVQLDILSVPARGGPELEEKEPLSLHVQGYEIQELIGGGGMGEVYRAVLLARGKEVAMKVVAGRLTRDPEVTTRFEGEVAALSQLDHPNVVRVLDHGETANGRHFLVTEYVHGCDLRRLLRAQRLETERAFDIFAKVCAGVAHAHERGLVHRDIKPANILIGLDGTVKVADFGLAKTLVDTSLWYGFTQTRDTFGTPYYVAPEVTRGAEEADKRADVYALGVLLYELLTGTVPMGKYTPLSERVGMDKKLDSIVAAALADDPRRRTGSVTELAANVAAVAARHRSGLARRPRSRRILGLAAVLVIGASFGSLLTQKGFRPAPFFYTPPDRAARDAPWVNSLGMKFVPVPDTGFLCAVHETRVRDFQEFFAADSAVLPDWRSGANDPRRQIKTFQRPPPNAPQGASGEGPNWHNPGPGFESQTPNHPVCGVSLVDARLFCAWLTWKERLEKRIRQGQRYRLPTTDEWSRAAQISLSQELLPPSPLDVILDPDADSRANFAGPEAAEIQFWPLSNGTLLRRDPFPRTAPVGSFPPNSLGIHDMSGNVAEWTDSIAPFGEDSPRNIYYIIRGGSWATGSARSTHASARQTERPAVTRPMFGFRVVLELEYAAAEPRPMDVETE